MEITLVNVPPPQGSDHATTSIAIANGAKTFLLTGVNLLRPLGVSLGGLPLSPTVENMSSVQVGVEAAHDGNLAVPGQAVIPIVALTPKVGFNMGNAFIRLRFTGGVLAIDPASPSPSTVSHVPMDTTLATVVTNWSLSDPNGFMVPLAAFQQPVALSLDHVDEGALALFTDRVGIDAVGLVVDVRATAGGGATVTAVMLSQVIGDAAVQAILQ